jgi:hypothetical protein
VIFDCNLLIRTSLSKEVVLEDLSKFLREDKYDFHGENDGN